MVDHAEEGGGGAQIDVFTKSAAIKKCLEMYVTHVRVHKSVRIIPTRAFYECTKLVPIEMHDGVEIIEDWAFRECSSLRVGIKLPSVKVIKHHAFLYCAALADVEFGDKLETNWTSSICSVLQSHLTSITNY